MSSEPLQNLRVAYQILERNVIRSLRTQRGDAAQLSIQVTEALQFLQAAEQHRAAFPPSEYGMLQQSITAMVASLDEARHLSSDPLMVPVWWSLVIPPLEGDLG
ncbi:hypothetical protein B0H10DRAFT_2213408 [Mycena sp. CBHHK59/15]|nr:hypothetical protein B0H10DRAFT_2213408 [Mycena sp. CBHHK59/15]